eukprot:COSAG04_NODE_786_length_10306_cov_4.792201_3_plen_133_part_00
MWSGGTSWGEEGYFRIARNATPPGICGVQTYVCYPRGVGTACPQPNKPGVCPPNTRHSRPAKHDDQSPSTGGPVAPRPPLPVLPRFRSDPEDYKLLFVDNTMFANLTGKFKDESSLSGDDRALLLSGIFLLR